MQQVQRQRSRERKSVDRGVKGERRSSRKQRMSNDSQCLPDFEQAVVAQGDISMETPNTKAAWNAAWEAGLKLQEENLNIQLLPYNDLRTTPVLDVTCKACRAVLTSRGMSAWFKAQGDRGATDLFTTNERPHGATEGKYAQHGSCNCRVRELNCNSCHANVGYYMEKMCNDCRAQTDEDQHKWAFFPETARGKPRFGADGEALLWPGAWERRNDDNSIAESPVPHCMDEICEPSPSPGTFGPSPLTDRNGRIQVDNTKAKHKRESMNSLEDDFIRRESMNNSSQRDSIPNSNQREPMSNANQRELMQTASHHRQNVQEREFQDTARNVQEQELRDAAARQEQTDRALTTAAMTLEAREQVLANFKQELDERERDLIEKDQERDQALQQAQSDAEAARRALDACEGKISAAEAEADTLRQALSQQTRIAKAAEDKVSQHINEIHELETTLNEVKAEVRNGVGGRGRLPPPEQATPEELRKRIRCLEQEVTAERVELQTLRLHLSQTQHRLESKETELESILPALAKTHLQGQTERSRKSTIGNEADRLRRERDAARKELAELRAAQLSDRRRSEGLSLRAPRASSCSARVMETSTTTGPRSPVEPDQFEEARLNVAAKLAKKRELLDQREQAIAAREAALRQQGATPQAAQNLFSSRPSSMFAGMSVPLPSFYNSGGSGMPGEATGVTGMLRSFAAHASCSRRQSGQFSN